MNNAFVDQCPNDLPLHLGPRAAPKMIDNLFVCRNLLLGPLKHSKRAAFIYQRPRDNFLQHCAAVVSITINNFVVDGNLFFPSPEIL